MIELGGSRPWGSCASVALTAPWKKDSKLGHIYKLAMTAIDKVTRHEATYERSMYKALHELERLQKARAGEYVPAPAVADLTIHSPTIDQAGATPE